jgi:hypothetical protein
MKAGTHIDMTLDGKKQFFSSPFKQNSINLDVHNMQMFYKKEIIDHTLK